MNIQSVKGMKLARLLIIGLLINICCLHSTAFAREEAGNSASATNTKAVHTLAQAKTQYPECFQSSLQYFKGKWICAKRAYFRMHENGVWHSPEYKLGEGTKYPLPLYKNLVDQPACAIQVGLVNAAGEVKMFKGMNPKGHSHFYDFAERKFFTVGIHPFVEEKYEPSPNTGWKDDTYNRFFRKSQLSPVTKKSEYISPDWCYQRENLSSYGKLETIPVFSKEKNIILAARLKLIESGQADIKQQIVVLEADDGSAKHLIGTLHDNDIQFVNDVIVGEVNQRKDLGLVLTNEIPQISTLCDGPCEPSFDKMNIAD